MKILSHEEEMIAIGRPRRTSVHALHSKAEDVFIVAKGKEDSIITTESIGRTFRHDESSRVVGARTAGHV